MPGTEGTRKMLDEKPGIDFLTIELKAHQRFLLCLLIPHPFSSGVPEEKGR